MCDWENTVNRHGPLVWRIARRMVGNEHDAADCFQDVFIEAFDVSRRKTIDNWPGFLTRLTCLRSIDVIRQRVTRQRKHREMPLETIADRSGGADSDDQRSDRILRLREALTHLSAIQVDVFCLKYFEQLSYEQIADRLGTDVNRVGVVLHRARAKLKRLILNSEARVAEIRKNTNDDQRTTG